MEFSNVFYEELSVDEDNFFSANLTKNNEIEQIKFKKSKIYIISGLSIDQDLKSNVSLRNIEGRKALSGILRVYGEEKKSLNLDLKIYKEGDFDIVVTFKKRMDVLINGFQYYDTTTQKQETIEFYDYYYHLKNVGFTWEHGPLEFKYEITVSTNEKTLPKKLTMSKSTRHKIAVDESRIIYTNIKNQVVTVSSEYIAEIPLYFNIKKPGQVKDLRNVSSLDSEKLRYQFKVKATNNWFHLPKTYYGTGIHMLQNHQVGYPETAWENLHVGQYYHDNADKNF